jgi:hypothetical protein
MERAPRPGECVVVVANRGSHGASVGDRLVVTLVDDNDSTCCGYPRGSMKAVDYWLHWDEVEPVRFGWEYAAAHLPPDFACLLGSCRFSERIALNADVKRAVLFGLPDWKDRVMAAIGAVESGTAFDD